MLQHNRVGKCYDIVNCDIKVIALQVIASYPYYCV